MNQIIVRTKNLSETQEFALKFAKKIKTGDVLCLYGDLGSGKTTFTQALAKGLGIKRRIISPTFIIVRSYKLLDLTFFHVDLYRTQTKEDLLGLGLDEIINSKDNITAIEWAEKLGEILPAKRIDLKFKYIGPNEREIEIEKYE